MGQGRPVIGAYVFGIKSVVVARQPRPRGFDRSFSLGLILIIILVIFLLGGFSGRFGGYGYGHANASPLGLFFG
jgi:hypothetical protein